MLITFAPALCVFSRLDKSYDLHTAGRTHGYKAMTLQQITVCRNPLETRGDPAEMLRLDLLGNLPHTHQDKHAHINPVYFTT